ncbi:MAG: L-histidine N(alpha)-methyltransferase [Thermoleophilaceae bacterium]
MTDLALTPRASIRSLLDGETLSTLAEDVRAGLTRSEKELSPKYLYDTRGSELFDQITALPEYYPTRCERMILNRRAPAIAKMTGARELVELGSGTASKTRALLYALAGGGALDRYVPFDCSQAVVERCAEELGELYPELVVEGVVGDFERHLGHVPDGDRRLIALLGGTLGNFHPPERRRFLSDVRDTMGERDWFLLGTDLVKDVALLEAAYNDSQGVTAEFNRNILHVINRELGGDFDPSAFEHSAVFDPDASWIEMRLAARSEQRVRIPGADLELTIASGERIRTEISTKFTLEALSRELTAAGMALEAFFTDPAGLFGLTLASPR